MSKWIDFSIDERKAMIQAVCQAKPIDEVSAEKDWWVTAVLYAVFHTSISDYLLFKGGTSFPVQFATAIHKYTIFEKKDRTSCLESSKWNSIES